MDNLYRDYILDHYRHPHHHGSLPHPDQHVEVDNPLCGDRLSFDLRFVDGQIADVAFQGRGCATSQATASMLTDAIGALSLAEAGTLRQADILEMLGVEVGPAP